MLGRPFVRLLATPDIKTMDNKKVYLHALTIPETRLNTTIKLQSPAREYLVTTPASSFDDDLAETLCLVRRDRSMPQSNSRDLNG